MQSLIAIKTENDAWALISDQSFLRRWQELYDVCIWATSFQSPKFVSIWFGNYKSQFSPVIIYQETDQHFSGLLILGQSVTHHKLVVAGGYQAEYQVWLEHPDGHSDFIHQALKAIALMLPGYNLAFKYLPEEAPLKSLMGSGKLNRRLGVVAHPRLFTSLSQESLDLIFSNKRNQRSLTRLSKLGNFEFHRIVDTDQFASIFDEIIAFYDFRQGAAHDRFPFSQDASKKPFHLDLLKNCSDLLHVTVTTLDGKILAAHIGVVSKNQLHLGIIAYSPFYAHYSPGIVHMMHLCKLLFQEGITQFDLTPGSDPTKERFANGYDQVDLLTHYRDVRARQIATIKAELINLIKSLSRSMRLSPYKTQAIYKRIKRFHFGKACVQLLKFTWKNSEVRVYRRVCEKYKFTPAFGLLNKDLFNDLIKYETNGRQSSKQTFMIEAMKRLARNEHFYTLVIADRLAYCSWLSEGQNERFLPEVQQTYFFPDRSVVLEYFYYDHGSMDKILLKDAVGQILFDVSESNRDKQIYIFIKGHDYLTRYTTESLGFEYQGSLHLQRIFGITRSWRSGVMSQKKWLARSFKGSV